jgi:hypothetical protein
MHADAFVGIRPWPRRRPRGSIPARYHAPVRSSDAVPSYAASRPDDQRQPAWAAPSVRASRGPVRNAPECVAQRDDARARDGSAQAFWQHGSTAATASCVLHALHIPPCRVPPQQPPHAATKTMPPKERAEGPARARCGRRAHAVRRTAPWCGHASCFRLRCWPRASTCTTTVCPRHHRCSACSLHARLPNRGQARSRVTLQWPWCLCATATRTPANRNTPFP